MKKLVRDEFEGAIRVAREYLQAGYGTLDAEKLCLWRDLLSAPIWGAYFATMVVKLANLCVLGMPCDRHGGVVHGQEAEELRAGVEQILCNTASTRAADAAFLLKEQRKSLIFLLDRIDARDSLAFREATDPKGPEDTACG